MNEYEPFHFCTERHLVALTGRKAKRLTELLLHLKEVSGSSIFYHVHQQYLARDFEKHGSYNDFANWVSRALQEERLAERLAALDLLAMTSIRQLREAVIAQVQRQLENEPNQRECPPGDELHFCEAKSFVMPTGIVARDVAEFFAYLPQIAKASLYFHFFEARLRLDRPTNDFSNWLGACGEERLARAIDRLNPYAMTLEELKGEILRLGNKRRTR